ncbi:MAG: sulfatase [Planctomycetes bacterium]|nr:sulfatase [Planctomycetota bacterium]
MHPSPRALRAEIGSLALAACLGAIGWTAADQLLWQRELAGDPVHALLWLAVELPLAALLLFVSGAFATLALAAGQRWIGVRATGARGVQLAYLPLLFAGALAAFEARAGSALLPLLGFVLLAILALLFPAWIGRRPPRSTLRGALALLGSGGFAVFLAAEPWLERATPLDAQGLRAQLGAYVLLALPLAVVCFSLAASRVKSAWLSLALVLPCGLAALRLELPPAKPAPSPQPNVLLIYCDTLRKDRVGLYDAEHGQTPEIDRFFEQGVVMDDAISPSSWTLPALTAVFGQRLPSLRLDVRKGDHVVTTETQTLAEALQERGYATGAFTANPLIFGPTGLLRGFEDMISLHHLARREEPDRMPPMLGRLAGFLQARYASDRRYRDRNPELVDRGLDWMEEQRERPFLLWLHFMSPHDPYDPPAEVWEDRGYAGRLPRSYFAPSDEGPNEVYLRRGWTVFDERDREHVTRLYDAETRGVDRELGRLFRALEQRGLLENTIVVLLSDHGEELWEHGDFYHGHSVYRELVEVPWLIRAPQLGSRRVRGPIGTIDLVPTLKEMLDVAPEAGEVERDGGSALARLRGVEHLGRAVISLVHREHLYAVRDARWCAIWNSHTGERKLFDRVTDPREERNLAAAQPEVFERYLPELRALEERLRARAARENGSPRGGPEDSQGEIDARMRSIGY